MNDDPKRGRAVGMAGARAFGLVTHIAAIIAGFLLMVLGLGLGVTVLMLPVAVPLGLLGLGLFLWGCFERFDRARE